MRRFIFKSSIVDIVFFSLSAVKSPTIATIETNLSFGKKVRLKQTTEANSGDSQRHKYYHVIRSDNNHANLSTSHPQALGHRFSFGQSPLTPCTLGNSNCKLFRVSSIEVFLLVSISKTFVEAEMLSLSHFDPSIIVLLSFLLPCYLVMQCYQLCPC